MGKLVARLMHSLPVGQFGRRVATLAGGTAVGQAMAILASPVLTRLYGPADFGVLTVYVSLLTLTLTVASLRYEMAIPLPEEDSTGANLLALSLAIVIAIGLVTGCAIWLLQSQIAAWMGASALGPYLWFLPLGVLAAGVYQALSYWALRKRQFRRIAQTRVVQAVGMIAIQIASGLLRAGPLGLLLGDVFGRFASSTTLARLLWKQDRHVLSRVDLRGIRQAGIRYRRFPLLSSVSGLLNAAAVQLPSLLLATFYGAQVAGHFGLGQRIMAVPMSLIGQAIAQAYYSEASRLVQNSPASLQRLFRTTAKRLLLLGATPMVLLALTGSRLCSLVFGNAWDQAGVYLQILAMQYLAQFVVVPLAKTPTVLERQDLQMAWDAGRLALVTGTLLATRVMAVSDRAAVGAYGAAMLVSYLGLFIMSSILLSRYVQSAQGRVNA